MWPRPWLSFPGGRAAGGLPRRVPGPARRARGLPYVPLRADHRRRRARRRCVPDPPHTPEVVGGKPRALSRAAFAPRPEKRESEAQRRESESPGRGRGSGWADRPSRRTRPRGHPGAGGSGSGAVRWCVCRARRRRGGVVGRVRVVWPVVLRLTRRLAVRRGARGVTHAPPSGSPRPPPTPSPVATPPTRLAGEPLPGLLRAVRAGSGAPGYGCPGGRTAGRRGVARRCAPSPWVASRRRLGRWARPGGGRAPKRLSARVPPRRRVPRARGAERASVRPPGGWGRSCGVLGEPGGGGRSGDGRPVIPPSLPASPAAPPSRPALLSRDPRARRRRPVPGGSWRPAAPRRTPCARRRVPSLLSLRPGRARSSAAPRPRSPPLSDAGAPPPRAARSLLRWTGESGCAAGVGRGLGLSLAAPRRPRALPPPRLSPSLPRRDLRSDVATR